jgi:hypothetical protein
MSCLLSISEGVAALFHRLGGFKRLCPAAAATPNSNRWFYVKFEPLMTRALVAGLVYRQRHAIEALLQDVNRDADRSGA